MVNTLAEILKVFHFVDTMLHFLVFRFSQILDCLLPATCFHQISFLKISSFWSYSFPCPSPPKRMMFSPFPNKQTKNNKQQKSKEINKIKKKARQEITNKKHTHESHGVLADCSWAWAFPGVWLINPGTLHWRKWSSPFPAGIHGKELFG